MSSLTMMKSLRLHRQRGRQEGVLATTAEAAAATTAGTGSDPEEVKRTLKARGGVLLASACRRANPRHKSPSSSSLTSQSSTGTAESAGSLHNSSTHGGDDSLLAEAATTTSQVATTKTTASLGVAASLTSKTAGKVRSLFPRGCLRVKTQHDSLQQKYYVEARALTPGARLAGGAAAHEVGRSTTTEFFDAAADSPARSVGFSDITVHSHQWILGDNPSVTSGPPISIEWTAFATSTVAVDDYEEGRQLQPPRHQSELQVPGGLRTAWMLRAGHTPEEIATAERQVRRDQQRRCANLPRDRPTPKGGTRSSPYDPCGTYNAQIKKRMAKLLGVRAWGGRKDDDDSEAVIYMDAPP